MADSRQYLVLPDDEDDFAGTAEARLTVLTVAILAVIAILLGFTGYQAIQGERIFFRDIALHSNQQIATLVARQFAQVFTNSTGLLQDMAGFPGVRRDAEKTVPQLFGVLLKRHEIYRALYLLDAQAKPARRVQYNVRARTHREIDQALFDRLARGEVASALSPFYKIEEVPAITFACAIRDGETDEFLGVLAAELDLNFIQDIIGAIKVGRTGEVLFVDRKGSIVFSSPGFKGLEEFSHFDVRSAFNARSGTAEYGKASPRLAAYRQVRSAALRTLGPSVMPPMFHNPITPGSVPDWLVVVQQSTEEAYLVANRMKYNIIILVVVGMIGLLVIARLWLDSL